MLQRYRTTRQSITSHMSYSAAASRAPTASVNGPPPRPTTSAPPQAPPRWAAPSSSQAGSKPHRHRPVTSTEELHVYVLTLDLTPSLHDPLNALRTTYFPSSRLKVPAHLTLFHALPHSKLSSITNTIASLTSKTKPFKITTGSAFLLGNQGVAIGPSQGTSEGAAVHDALRAEWEQFLSKQDSKGFKAHWTVQNKVEDWGEVERTFEEVKRWTKEVGAEGEAKGLVLWRYDKGKWVFEKQFAFEG